MATIRGKILKVPDVTPGLLFVDGQQKSFEINGIWQSNSIAPSTEMVVDVELNAGGTVVAVTPVADADLAKEQARLAMDAAGAKSKEMAGKVLDRVGKPALIALAAIVLGWFFLDFYSVKVGSSFFEVTVHASLWRQVGYLHVLHEDMDNLLMMMGDLNRYSGRNADMPPTGLLGLLGIAALLAPLLPAVWKDKRAVLGALAPLFFLLLVVGENIYVAHAIKTEVRDSIGKSMSAFTGLFSNEGAPLTDEAQKAIDKQFGDFSKSIKFNLGLGFYITVLGSLYLAGQGGMKYLALKGRTS